MKKLQDPRNEPDVSEVYQKAKRATVKMARALYPGCVIEAYFSDSETPERCLVVGRPDAHAGIYDIKVLKESSWNSKARNHTNTPRYLNTDKWILLGEAPFPAVPSSQYKGEAVTVEDGTDSGKRTTRPYTE